MAFTVEYRPAIFAAVRTTVGYKFETTGGPFTNYRIEVDVFKASDNTSLTNGTKFSFTPNAAGITFADISSIVKAYLKAEWANPVALNEVEPETSLKVYIKYQELYDGSATSVIDDVASPRTFVFAALQIPSATGGDMQNYVPFDNSSKFLTRFDRPKLWRGYPATLSFIFPNGLGLWLTRTQYTGEAIPFVGVFDSTSYALIFQYAHGLSDGDTVYINSAVESYNGNWVIDVVSVNSFLLLPYVGGPPVIYVSNTSGTFAQTISETIELNAANDDHVNRLFIDYASWLLDTAKTITLQLRSNGTEVLSNPFFDTALTPWSNVAGAGANWAHYGAGISQSANASLGGGLTISDPLRQDFTATPAGQYTLRIKPWAGYALGAQDTTLTIKAYYLGVLTETLAVYTATLPASIILAVNVDLPVTPTTQFDRIEIVAERTNPADDPREVRLKTVSLKSAVYINYSEPLTLDVVDPCANPVMLEWKNSIGGDAWWMFDHNQEASYNYSGSKKAKRMSLSVNDLTVNQWEALNEIFTLGEVYRKNIVEFTALVDKTAVRNDAQVYVVNADGSKTGVIVLPTNNILFTRHKRHTFHIEIEFPEVQ